MNYSIAVTQDAYSITVEGIPEAKKLITQKAISNPNEAAIKKLKRYVEKRGISAYEMAHVNPNSSVSSCGGWFLYDSTKDMECIVINCSMTGAAKVDVLVHLLCLHEAINKHWQLYLSDRDRFDRRLNTFIARVTKIISRENIATA